MNPLLIGLMGLGAWEFLKPKAPPAPVAPVAGMSLQHPFVTHQGPESGKTWLTRVVGERGIGPDKTAVVEVWAAEGSYPREVRPGDTVGFPHGQVHVASYEQHGEHGPRTVCFINPAVPGQMVTDAGKDFRIQKA